MRISTYTVALLGDSSCGKTCLFDRHIKVPAGFNLYEDTTIGAHVAAKTVFQDHDRGVRFKVWDCGGFERFRRIITSYWMLIDVVIMMYDITQQDSLRNTREWFDLLRYYRSRPFTALAGNKADLVDLRRVTYEDGQSYAREMGVDLFMEVSALTGENVEKLFLTIAVQLRMDCILSIYHDKTLNLERMISGTVAELTAVETLNVFLATTPTGIPRSANLTTLNLNHNKLTQFPEVVLDLINLTHLYVNGNQLSTLPANLNSLEKLQELGLKNNKLKRVFKYIVDLTNLEKLSVKGNPLTFQEIRSLTMLMDLKSQRILIDIAVPAEIQAQGDFQKLLYEKALKEGSVNVYRGRVLLVGQDRAGKTTLKKSLLGLPFNSKEPSTEGIEVDPSVCKIEVEQVKNWNSMSQRKASLAEFSEDISRMLAEKQYHWIVNELKEHSKVISELELTGEESTMEVDTNSHAMNKVPISVGNLQHSTISPPESEMRVKAVAENTVDDLTDDRNASSSKNATLMMDATSPSDDVTKHAYLRLRKVPESVSNLKNSAISPPESEVRVEAVAKNTVDDLTDDGNTNSDWVFLQKEPKDSTLMVDATSPSDDVTKHAYLRLNNMLKGVHGDAENANDRRETIVTVDLWDFAGQHLYYASHPVFLSSRAVYVLVHNLNKALDAPAQPCVRQGTHDKFLENPNNETNLENLLSWLVTIHSIRPTGEEMAGNSDGMLPYLRPPVFIVGTHADKPFEDIEVTTSKIQQGISGKEYEKHVIRPFFTIDNTLGEKSLLRKIKKLFVKQPQGRKRQAGRGSDTDVASDDGIHALRTKIMDILRQEPYMGEKIPVKWFNFEKVVEALVAENVYHMNVEQLQTYAKEVCFIEDEDQFSAMLHFYHNLGMIVKHRSTVILKAQWLIELFKMLITIPPFNKADPIASKYFLEVETSGVLSMELVDRVFSKFIQQGLVKEDILNMMEQFGLIAKFSASLTDVKYFVPCQLKSPPEKIAKMEPLPTDPCPLYLHFVDGFVPHGFFSQFVSRSISWCSKIGSVQPPNLYRDGAWFVVGRQIIYDMTLICKKRFIKISLKQRTEEEAVPVSTLLETARSVRLFVEDTLQDLVQQFQYLGRLQYEFCVACPYCLPGSQECVKHSQTLCTHEDCLHLLEIKEGERLICMKSGVSDKVLTVPGVEKWYPKRTSQDLFLSTVAGKFQGEPEQGDPGTTKRVLKVTLLASEWRSCKGGLSTINRELALKLAQYMEVEVTFLVPQFACSEEERRFAKSHNITIREAVERPGYDSLEWLSFPPRDLAIDVVIGHGAKLGKQAQVIRESHSCKWVQVVHTAPEELGMHKNYSKAISKGEEKHKIEVGLCKLANVVLAVGPKLKEVYTAYLGSCKDHQDVIQLTPGIFREFSGVRKTFEESKNFRVLTFGRGDPEDFSLKGYDIAVKAMVELKDSSYRLLFVGAPDGKEEDVAKNLLQCGISKDQLVVRKFVQNKEGLKELFCEADLAIMPSRTEGFGLTALEALSAGLPILVSGNSGFGDALRSLPSGKPFVVETDDPKAWGKAIAAVRLKDRAERLEEIQRLRTSYEDTFSWEKQCEALVQNMWQMVYGLQG